MNTTTIKIYYHSNFLENKIRKHISKFNYYNLYKDSCYYCKDVFKLKRRTLKDLFFKNKNIISYTFNSHHYDWKIFFSKENLFKTFKTKNNTPIVNSFNYLYVAPMLDTVTHLNDLLYSLNKDTEEYKEIENIIMFFYSLPLSSILVLDNISISNVTFKDFLNKE